MADQVKNYNRLKGDLEKQLRAERQQRLANPVRVGDAVPGSGEPFYENYSKHGNAESMSQVDVPPYSAQTIVTPGEFEDMSAIAPGLLAEDFIVETPDSAYSGLREIQTDLRRFLDSRSPATVGSPEDRDFTRKALERMTDLGVSSPSIDDAFSLDRYISQILMRPSVQGVVQSDKIKHERIRAQKDRVRGMQARLAEQGFYEGTPDGVYDDKTVKAIRAAQAAGVKVPSTIPR